MQQEESSRLGGGKGDIPGFDQMGDGEEDAKDNAEAADSDVCDPKEVVLAAHYGTGREEEGFKTRRR